MSPIALGSPFRAHMFSRFFLLHNLCIQCAGLDKVLRCYSIAQHTCSQRGMFWWVPWTNALQSCLRCYPAFNLSLNVSSPQFMFPITDGFGEHPTSCLSTQKLYLRCKSCMVPSDIRHLQTQNYEPWNDFFSHHRSRIRACMVSWAYPCARFWVVSHVAEYHSSNNGSFSKDSAHL